MSAVHPVWRAIYFAVNMSTPSASFLVLVAVAIVFALARKYAPPKVLSTAKENYSQEELNARFRTTQWIVGISGFAVGGLLAWILYAVAVWLNRYWASLDGPADYVIWPQSAIWWFLPLFTPLALAWEITLQIWSLLGHRAEANLYGYWSGNSARFNSRKVLRWMGLLVVVPIAVFTFLAVSIHTTLRPNDIRDCGYAFTTCKTYSYADARRMIDGFRNRDGSLPKGPAS